VDVSVFLRGLIFGLSIAAPVGPIGVLCIRRTLAYGRLTGFASGLGAASADGIYGSIAAFGLTAISDVLIGGQIVLRLVGGLFLLYLGIKTFRSRPTAQEAEVKTTRRGLFGAYSSTLFLTLTNPATIFSFFLIFGSLGLAETGRNYAASALVVLGVVCGSALWWFILSGGVSLLRSRVTPNLLAWINRASGVIICGFGVVALASLIAQ
jgi:threonine/homoserine/homoserine lactone efflux protein